MYDPDHGPASADWLGLDEGARLEQVRAYHRRERIAVANERLHAAIHVVVETQAALGEAVVVDTLERLQREGLSRHDAVHAVGSVLADRILDAMRTKTAGPRLAVSYLESLKALTAQAWKGDGPVEPPPVRIDHFRAEHREAFAALNRAWLVEHGILEPVDELSLRIPRDRILARGGEIFVALQGVAVLGTAAIIPHGAGVMEPRQACGRAARPTAGNRPAPRRFLLADTHRQGAGRVMLVSSSRLKAALRLYEVLGFQHRPMPPNQPVRDRRRGHEPISPTDGRMTERPPATVRTDRESAFDAACALVGAALAGLFRRDIVAELSAAHSHRPPERLRQSMRGGNVWKVGARQVGLERIVGEFDRRTRQEGFHALNDWDGKADHVNDDIIPVDVLDYLIARAATRSGRRRVALAILLDYYFFHLLSLYALRVWDEATPTPTSIG